ncbi:caspase family protein [Luteimonas sp. A537]
MQGRWWLPKAAVLLLGCLLAFPTDAAGKRVALVIGISDYQGADRLDAAVSDARLVSGQLRAIGFQVTESTNGSYRSLGEDLADFTADAAGADIALFYYAGHGFEVGGENFLMPVDIGQSMATVDRATVRMRGLPLSTVLRDINAAGPRSLVAVIDACRDAPARGGQSRGMGVPELGDGAFLAYSTRPGERAIDSAASLGHQKRNSPFALYFAENLAQPGLTLLELMQATQSQVNSFTQGRQRPWFASELNGPLVLHAPKPAAAADSPFASTAGAWAGPNAMCPPERTEASRLWNTEMRAVEAGLQGLTTEGLALLRRDADAGELRALATLGLALDRGTGVTRNRTQARRHWQQAAEAGYVIAQTLLGEALHEDATDARAAREARKWLERASQAGFARATLDLAGLQDNNQDMASALMLAFCQGTQGFNTP